jgi:site-specific DNA-methyltransferase (adenine-specific)
VTVIHRNRTVFSSLTCEWRTPRSIFQKLDEEFHFEIDVAANRENALCGRFFDLKTNAIMQHWAPAVCWMNPPYGPDIPKWMRKAWEESRKGATVVCLVPSRTDTGWWHDYVLQGEIRFLRGRLRFNEGGKATFPSAVVIFRSSESIGPGGERATAGAVRPPIG